MSIEIEVPDKEDLKNVLMNDQNALTFRYWDISSEYSVEEYNEDKTKISSDLHSFTDEDLDSKYEGEKIIGSFSNGIIYLKGIENGLYYFRNDFSSQTKDYSSRFVIYLNNNAENVRLIYKLVENPKDRGMVKLIKEDQDKKGLKSVGFELYEIKENGNNKVPLIGNYVYNEEGSKDQILYTDENGEINVSNLPYGKYFFKEVKGLEGYKLDYKELKFEIKDNELVILHFVNKKIEVGGYKFLKIAADKNKSPLKGATFKVTQIIDGKEETVIKDGKELLVESSKDGTFEVSNLPYGDYYLWEVNAPKGYKKLMNGVKFTIKKDSDSKVLVIKNEHEPEINVPKTGDLVIPLLLVVSLVIFGTGFKLSKDKKKEK